MNVRPKNVQLTVLRTLNPFWALRRIVSASGGCWTRTAWICATKVQVDAVAAQLTDLAAPHAVLPTRSALGERVDERTKESDAARPASNAVEGERTKESGAARPVEDAVEDERTRESGAAQPVEDERTKESSVPRVAFLVVEGFQQGVNLLVQFSGVGRVVFHAAPPAAVVRSVAALVGRDGLPCEIVVLDQPAESQGALFRNSTGCLWKELDGLLNNDGAATSVPSCGTSCTACVEAEMAGTGSVDVTQNMVMLLRVVDEIRRSAEGVVGSLLSLSWMRVTACWLAGSRRMELDVFGPVERRKLFGIGCPHSTDFWLVVTELALYDQFGLLCSAAKGAAIPPALSSRGQSVLREFLHGFVHERLCVNLGVSTKIESWQKFVNELNRSSRLAAMDCSRLAHIAKERCLDDSCEALAEEALRLELLKRRCLLAAAAKVAPFELLSRSMAARLAAVRPSTLEGFFSLCCRHGHDAVDRSTAQILVAHVVSTAGELGLPVDQDDCAKVRRVDDDTSIYVPKPAKKTSSLEQSYACFLRGLNVVEIAQTRGLSVGTIQNHLIDAIRLGFQFSEVDFHRFGVTQDMYDLVLKALDHLEGCQRLKPLLESLPQGISYAQIRLCLALHDSGLDVFRCATKSV